MAKVLVVDDDPVQLRLMRHILEAEGHAVTDAVNVVEAKAVVRSEGFDLVITDILMPGGNGVELVAHLHTNSPSLRVVAMSAGRGPLKAEFNMQSAAMAGAVVTLVKPINRTALLRAVHDALNAPAP